MNQQAKEVLQTARHGALATVDEEGVPLATPLHTFFDEKRGAVYWFSHPDSDHSRNILYRQYASLAIWISPEGAPSQGVYIQGYAEPVEGSDRAYAQELVERIAGSFPPIFADTVPYRMRIGVVDREKTKENRWYFYT